MPKLAAPLTLLLAAPASVALAQSTSPEEPIQTTRPDFVTTPQIVPLGHLQLEFGATFYGRGGAMPARWELGEGTLRYGLRRNVELRVEGLSGVLRQEAGGLDGPDDATVSAVFYLGRLGDIDLGLYPNLTLPTGRTGIGYDGVTPEIYLLAKRETGGGASLRTTVGTAFARQMGRDAPRTTLAVSYLQPLDRRLKAFVEYAGYYEPIGAPTHYAHAGLRLLLSRTSGIDLHAATALNRSTEPGFVGAGYAIRF